MRILLTGATGYLGSWLARTLHQAGHELILPVRRESPALPPPGPRLRLVRGELTEPASWRPWLPGCQALVHAAALVSTWERDPGRFDRVNVAGTLRLIEEAASAGLTRILYVSSFLALDPSPDGRPRSEDHPPSRAEHWNDYERTKFLANRAAIELQDRGLPLVILYPGVLYGPGPLTAGNLVTGLVRDCLRGKLPVMIGDGAPRWSFVHVEDVAQGVRLALERAAPPARCILGGDNRSLREFFLTLEQVSGVRGPRLALPFGAARQVGRLEELLAWATGRRPRTTRGAIEIFRHHWSFDSSLAVRELGYAFRPLREGLRQTVDWLRQEGLVPPGPEARS